MQTELELSLCLFDAPTSLVPQYVSWVCRRVGWLEPLSVPQFETDRIVADAG